MRALSRIREFEQTMIGWRHDLHMHPEIGFEEHRTSEFIARTLAGFGLEVHRNIGKTGVVGRLAVGDSRRSIGLRADMDALPIEEINQFSHRSTVPGRMHACGHDGHVASLLGAARYLSEARQFNGVVHFIFQPAEEGLGGANAMLADGLFERFPCDVVFGFHNAPALPIGKFSIRGGVMMAGGAFFDITVKGKGAHGAHPEQSVDPVLTASHVVTALQSIASRNVAAVDAAVVSVTKIEAGDAYNVVPNQAVISGTARWFKPEVLDVIKANLRRIAVGVAEGFGASALVDFRVIFVPLVNTQGEAAFAADVAAEIAGEANVDRARSLMMGSEDFSFMLEKVPGAYINVGNGESAGLHNPGYDFNDEALPYAATIYARLVERKLATNS
ncbi:M20 aminoacylase family protein [Bradyrhizobium icense]|uniref:Amidohydrolase n=1 Tax=Bradyrhizobium icense TaxID=1274631 RepID=A0A1B1UBP8_9BRAD|nr:M20 aminoacylase family protein [Bradyrhizobium icense]ANW00163.1 amidohydrolase [Bradyrhizobium icense]